MTSLGVSEDIERAFNFALGLAPGEYVKIPQPSKADARKLRRLFFRMRKRAQREALEAGEPDPNAADPWRGLVTEVTATALTIRRPLPITHVWVGNADGEKEQEL